MSENYLMDFRYACAEYLETIDIANLRAYARAIGVTYPTKMKKTALVEEVVDILSGAKPRTCCDTGLTNTARANANERGKFCCIYSKTATVFHENQRWDFP